WLIMELGDGLLGLGRSGHLHEPEPPRLPREAIRDHGRGLDGPALSEVLAKAIGSGRIRKPTDIQLGRHQPSNESQHAPRDTLPRLASRPEDAEYHRRRGWIRGPNPAGMVTTRISHTGGDARDRRAPTIHQRVLPLRVARTSRR